jgi:xanthine dehydrogenase YagR molybdenum-binding subunit
MAERKFAWPARKDTTLIGREIPRIDAVEKCTGKAKYTADINTPGTLFCRLFTSDQLAHGKIKKIDTSAAEKIPGVRAVHLF